MTPTPGSKHDKDDFCEFIYCVQHTFTLLLHECYFSRTCIIPSLACLNVHCMCAYAIVCVCVCVSVCVCVHWCECVCIACVCACVPEYVWVCLCLYVYVCLEGFLDWCCVFDLGMHKTHMVTALF